MSQAKPSALVSRDFPVHSAVGALVDFDAAGSGYLVRNGVDTAEVVTITNAKTGVYRYQATIPVAWVEGDQWEVRIEALVGGVTTAGIVDAGVIAAKLPGELAADVETRLSDDFAALPAAVRSNLTTELARIDVVMSSRAAPGAQMALIDSAITAAKITANAIGAAALSDAAVAKIEAALLNEGDGQALIDAIVQAVDAADIDANLISTLTRDAILNRVLPGNHDATNTVGLFLQQLDALLSSRLAAGSYTAPDNAGVASIQTVLAGGVTVADIAIAALAKFITSDTSQAAAAAGSVAKISQGSAGGNVIVGAMTPAALTQFVTDNTGESAASAGSVAKLSQGSAGGGGGTQLVYLPATREQEIGAVSPLDCVAYVAADFARGFKFQGDLSGAVLTFAVATGTVT